MILGDVLTEVRDLVQDSRTPYRYSDEFLLRFANQTLQRIATLRPDLFALYTVFQCTVDRVAQQLPSDAHRLIEVHGHENGDAITEISREAMDLSYPSWRSDPAGPAVNWMRNVRNPRHFFIYPRAPADQRIDLQYAQVPPTYDATTEVALLPDSYFPCVVDGTVYLVEAVDNEAVDNKRAAQFLNTFTEALTGSASNRPLTDTESGGMNNEEVM